MEEMKYLKSKSLLKNKHIWDVDMDACPHLSISEILAESLNPVWASSYKSCHKATCLNGCRLEAKLQYKCLIGVNKFFVAVI